MSSELRLGYDEASGDPSYKQAMKRQEGAAVDIARSKASELPAASYPTRPNQSFNSGRLRLVVRLCLARDFAACSGGFAKSKSILR
jgi:hypothetical protein